MSVLNLVLALAMPWVLGIVWLRGNASLDRPGSVPMVAGYGLMLGWLMTAVTIRLWGAVGWPLNFWPLLGVLGVLLAIGFFAGGRWRWPGVERSDSSLFSWLVLVMGALILIRFASEAAEILWRPLYPWDAWVNWAPKAKLWFGLGRTVPILSPNQWLAAASPEVYTLPMHHYPVGAPLFQLWVSLALGRWDPMLINLPWLFAPLAMGLALFGQLRRWGVSAALAFAGCYMLLSLPMVSIHTALAGYADLWLGVVYGMAAMAFFHWARTGNRADGLVALLFALSCGFFKVQGVIWALTFLPALIAVRWSWKWLLVAAFAAVALVVVLAFVGVDLRVPGLGQFALNTDRVIIFHFLSAPIAFYATHESFLWNMFTMPNWHLFWYLMVAGLVTGVLRRRDPVDLAPRLVLTLSGLAFLFTIFFLTTYAMTAQDLTAINRILMHIVPMLMFVVLSLFPDQRMR